MPKSTFYNLNEEKKEKIKKALKKEFTNNTFEKASISNIVEQAKIPRGSFYQYFEDKEDALKYIIEDFLNAETEQIKKLLLINNGDLFLTTIDLYSYFVDKNYNQDERKLFQNIVSKLRNDNVNIFKDIQLSKMKNIKDIDYKKCFINIDILNIEKKEEIGYIMRILTCILRSEIIDVIHGKISKEDGKKALAKQIEILKKGMRK